MGAAKEVDVERALSKHRQSEEEVMTSKQALELSQKEVKRLEVAMKEANSATQKLLEEIATTPDYHHYGNALVKKAEPIYRAMGWDLDKVKFDINQKTLDEWW